MQTVIRTLAAIALVVACSPDKRQATEPSRTEPAPPRTEPAPVSEPVAAAPIDAAPTAVPTPAPSTTPTPAPDPTPPPKTLPNQGPPQNLKVLPKRWSRKKLTKYMKDELAKGLGVKCKECHDTNDFAADRKDTKDTARAMIKMQNDINKRFFDGKSRVRCVTCHMGSKEPAGE